MKMAYLDTQLLKGETLTIEYKDDNHDGFSDTKIVEAAVAMANAAGGKILVGVTDKGKLRGSRRLGAQWVNEKTVEAIIAQNTRPSLSTRAEILTYEEFKIICIEVPIASSTVGTSSGKYLKRTFDGRGEPTNLPMSAEEIAGKVSVIGSTDFTANRLFSCSIDEIDLELVTQTAKSILEKNKLTRDEKEIAFFSQSAENILKGLGLIDTEGQPNIACLLLFGKVDSIKNRIPQSFVQFQVFSGRSEILRNDRYEGPIVKLIPQLLELDIFARNSDEFTYRGESVRIPEYASDAIREVIANALVHRDYTFPNAIQIQVFNDQLTVTSPGGFPQGVTVDRLLSVAPSPRNRRLAEALYRLRLVESSGRGVDFIYYGQARYGRPVPDYGGSTSNSVSVRLKGGKANLEFCKLVLSIKNDLTINEMLLLNAMFFHRDLTLIEATNVIQVHESHTKEILLNMHKSELIEYQSEGEERYFLKGSISPFARAVISPRRLTKQELISYKELICKELRRKKIMSKAALADAVGLSEPQCYRLLRDLVADDKVRQTKDKKWELN